MWLEIALRHYLRFILALFITVWLIKILWYSGKCKRCLKKKIWEWHSKKLFGIDEYKAQYSHLLDKVNLIFDGLPLDPIDSEEEIKKRLVQIDLNRPPFESIKLNKKSINKSLFSKHR